MIAHPVFLRPSNENRFCCLFKIAGYPFPAYSQPDNISNAINIIAHTEKDDGASGRENLEESIRKVSTVKAVEMS